MTNLLQLVLPITLLFNANASGDGQETAPKKGDRGAKIQELDKDNDGYISKSEAAGTPLADHFSKIDSNSDGKLSSEELKAARKARHEQRGDGSGRKEDLAKRDTNGDGVWSKAELEGTPLAAHFDEIDTDKSGTLTKAELKAAHDARKKARGAKSKTRSK